MKTRSLLEQLIRKMIFEQSDTKTGFIKQKPKTVKSQPVANDPEVRKVSIRPGSDTAVLDGWKHGAARVGNARTTFEVKVANRGKGEVDAFSEAIIGAISTSREYGINSKYAKISSPDTPTGNKYAYVIGDNVSKLPRHGKFNVWIVNLEILYKIANQIDAKLGIDDSVVSNIESFEPTQLIANFIPIYQISMFERLVNTIKSYMRDPKIGGSLIIPTAGVEFNKSNNEITITDEKVFPDLTGLDKEYIESNIDTTPQNQTFETGDGSISGFLNFIGEGQTIIISTGESKFMPIKGSIDIFRKSDDAVGKFEGTFKKGYPDTGTLTWSDMKPYTGIIRNDAIAQILVPNPDQTGPGESSRNVVSFTINYNASKLKSGEDASTEVISNKTTESEIQYPYVWTSGAGDFTVIKLASKPTIVFYKDDKRWMYINQRTFEDAINSEAVVEIIPQRVTDKGLIAELETELTTPITSEPTPTTEPETTSGIKFPYYETSNGGFTVITLSSSDPYVYCKDSQNKWYTLKKADLVTKRGVNKWKLISDTAAIAKLENAKNNTPNFKVAVNNKTVTPKPVVVTQTQIFLKNPKVAGVTIKRFVNNGSTMNLPPDSKYTTKQNDKFYKTATKNVIVAGETYMNVKFPDGKTYWVYADSFK